MKMKIIIHDAEEGGYWGRGAGHSRLRYAG
jgi:hypothetical protein